MIMFRPIKTWPDSWLDAEAERLLTPFDSTYSQTMRKLQDEVSWLGTEDAVVQLDVKDRGVTREGLLRSDVKVWHPGVIVTIDSRQHGPLVYSCDRYVARGYRDNRNQHWHENLRAVALGLEALRKVERYGIATRGEQYAGYKEIGSGIPLGSQPPDTMTADAAARMMIDVAGMAGLDSDDVIVDADTADVVYRKAAKRLHPDAGGSTDDMARLNEARRIVARAYRR